MDPQGSPPYHLFPAYGYGTPPFVPQTPYSTQPPFQQQNFPFFRPWPGSGYGMTPHPPAWSPSYSSSEAFAQAYENLHPTPYRVSPHQNNQLGWSLSHLPVPSPPALAQAAATNMVSPIPFPKPTTLSSQITMRQFHPPPQHQTGNVRHRQRPSNSTQCLKGGSSSPLTWQQKLLLRPSAESRGSHQQGCKRDGRSGGINTEKKREGLKDQYQYHLDDCSQFRMTRMGESVEEWETSLYEKCLPAIAPSDHSTSPILYQPIPIPLGGSDCPRRTKSFTISSEAGGESSSSFNDAESKQDDVVSSSSSILYSWEGEEDDGCFFNETRIVVPRRPHSAPL